jgi:hypothetical protein
MTLSVACSAAARPTHVRRAERAWQAALSSDVDFSRS